MSTIISCDRFAVKALVLCTCSLVPRASKAQSSQTGELMLWYVSRKDAEAVGCTGLWSVEKAGRFRRLHPSNQYRSRREVITRWQCSFWGVYPSFIKFTFGLDPKSLLQPADSSHSTNPRHMNSYVTVTKSHEPTCVAVGHHTTVWRYHRTTTLSLSTCSWTATFVL